MKIVIPTADYPPIEGGISTVTVNLARELVKLGHDVTVVAPYFKEGLSFDKVESAPIVRYRGYGLGPLRVIPMMCAALPKTRGADLVVAINVASSGVVGCFSRTLFGVPFVVLAYAYEFLKFRSKPIASGLLNEIYRRAARTIAISSYTRNRLIEFGVHQDKVAVVHPGAPDHPASASVQPAEYRRKLVLDDRRVILSAGRLIPRKGHLTLIRAMPKILGRVPHAHLVVVGRGPQLSDCARMAQRLGVRANVTFTGYVSDGELAALYTICDVFALPAGEDADGHVEGFGLVYSEAHAHGKPVVAGRTGGAVDAVIDGETGLLVDPTNVDSVADAVIQLLTDHDLAARMGEAGRRRVESELNWRVFTQRLLEAAGVQS